MAEQPLTVIQARSRLGVVSRRKHSADYPDDIIAARRDLAAAKIEAYTQKILQDAPPLLPEQRDHIISLLTREGTPNA